mgnify:CR=1 FL=1
MRVVTAQIMRAWSQGKRKTVGNTWTDGYKIYLHGNCIVKTVDGHVYISDGGYWSATTRERLNGFLRHMGVKAYVSQKNFAPYYCEQPWDGNWTLVY